MRCLFQYPTIVIKTAYPFIDAPFSFKSLVSFVFKDLSFHQTPRHLIPSATFECATRSLLLRAAPLLEEKWDLDSQTLISNIRDPFLHDRFRTETIGS